jgi:hypothetical protein
VISRRSVIRTGAGVGAAAALTVSSGGMLLAGAGSAAAAPSWDRLRAALSGTLVLPGESTYDQAIQLHQAKWDVIHPQAVAYCQSSADIAACIRFAQDNGLASSVRSGGHSNAGYSTSPGLVIDVSRLNGVRASGSTVRLGPGAQGVDIVNTLSPLGLQVISGTCPTVAMGGFMQGGGLGPASRKYGTGADRLVSAKVVLADGRIVTASNYDNADLFWALRGGGGGNFGVVTEYEVRPVSVPSLTLFNLTFAWADAVDLVQAWQQWIISGPRELNTQLLFTLATDQGGDPHVILTGTYAGAQSTAESVLNAFMSSHGKASVTRQVVELPYQQAMMAIFGCGDKTVNECHRIGYSPEAVLPREYNATYRNTLFSQAQTRTAVQATVARMEASLRPGQFRVIGFFSYGGRVNDYSTSATAYSHRTTQFEVGIQIALTTAAPSQEDQSAGNAWLNTTFNTAEASGNHEAYQNFMDPALANWQQAYYGRNYPVLQAIKRAYDPYRYFNFAQAIA